MAVFKKAKNNTFDKKVTVYFGDEVLGDLDVTFEIVSQDELVDLAETQNDKGMCARVIKRVGDIPVEGSDEIITGDAAIQEVLNDARAVSACAAAYLDAMKGNSFRNRAARGRR